MQMILFTSGGMVIELKKQYHPDTGIESENKI